MPARTLDAEIDRLYQLPLDEFTAARNLLAKQGGAEVKSLAKPPVAAWAVNQLYWKNRAPYDALIRASNEMRRTHKTVLAGKGGDLRAAGKAHDEALDAALKATLSLLEESGQPVTDATRQAIVTTLRALPSDEQPGRLTRTLQPGGFEMLAGFSIAGEGRALTARPSRPTPIKEPTTAKPDRTKSKDKEKLTPAQKAAAAAAAVKAREAVTAATRELRQAEHAAQREEFEAARAAREAEKAERQAATARTAFEEARAALEEAEAAVPPAQRARDAAARRAQQAEEKLEAARQRLEVAQSR
jgi:hypothetical protein